MLRITPTAVLALLLGCASSTTVSTPEPTATHQPLAEPRQPTRADPPEIHCDPFIAPAERTGGSLTVHASPKERTRRYAGRMRNHVDGALSVDSQRVWIGPRVPGFVPLTEGTMELFLLDHQPDGSFLAVYRDPYGVRSCTLSDRLNCDHFVTRFARCGSVQWSIALSGLMSRAEHLEIQDIRLRDGTLYFNEACSGSREETEGRCSSLVAVDPRSKRVRWRTEPLVSNSRFLVVGQHIVAGYGVAGYGESPDKDMLRVVRRSDGKIMQSLELPWPPEDIRLAESGEVQVIVHPGDVTLRFGMADWDTKAPKLVKLEHGAAPNL